VIKHQVEQGSEAWHKLRIGIPTASEFDRIITSTGLLSKSSRKYAHWLVAERVLGRSLESFDKSEWITRGTALEPVAARAYEFEQGVKTEKVGFCTTDDGLIGASPDRLIIGAAGGVELKCPAPQTHMGYLIEGFGSDYIVQVQGQMYVAELDYVDRFAFHDEMPSVRDRTYRDAPFIRKLADALEEFNDQLDAMLERVRALGAFDMSKPVSPVDAAYSPITELVEDFR
jgi:hypothetical protein